MVVSVVVSAVNYGDGAHMKVDGGDGYTKSESRRARVTLQRVFAERFALLRVANCCATRAAGDIILIGVDMFDRSTARTASSTSRTRGSTCLARSC